MRQALLNTCATAGAQVRRIAICCQDLKQWQKEAAAAENENVAPSNGASSSSA